MAMILLAVRPSVFSWGMLGFRSSSAAVMLQRLEKGVYLPSPRLTHPARVAVVALASTCLLSISEMPQEGGPLKGTCHPPLNGFPSYRSLTFCPDVAISQ